MGFGCRRGHRRRRRRGRGRLWDWGSSPSSARSGSCVDRVSHFFRELSGRAASTDAGRSTDFFRERSGRAASIGVKIEPKSVPGGSPGHPKSIPNSSGDLPELPGAPGRHPRASWSIPGAPRGGPKAVRECPKALQGRPGEPKRVPGSARRRLETTEIDAESPPGAKK